LAVPDLIVSSHTRYLRQTTNLPRLFLSSFRSGSGGFLDSLSNFVLGLLVLLFEELVRVQKSTHGVYTDRLRCIVSFGWLIISLFLFLLGFLRRGSKGLFSNLSLETVRYRDT
jgi:hypothetical protein